MNNPHDLQSNDEPPGWELRTLRAAREPRAATAWVVDGLFAEGTLNMAYGAPGSLKSMIMLDCACAVAGGHDWLIGTRGDRAGVPVTQSPILWYDYDNGTRRSDERFDAVSRGHKLPDDAPIYYVSMPEYAYYATDLERNIYLMGVINQIGARLVVLDNLSLITGDVEENSAAMAQVMASLRIIAERTRAAIVVIHHQRKGGAAGSRAGDALRGHSSIEASLDLALQVVREPGSPEVSIRSTKTRGVDVAPMIATFYYEHTPGTTDMHAAWFTGKSARRGDNPVEEAIVTVVTDAAPDGVTKTMLKERAYELMGGRGTAPGINTIRAAIEEMIAHGKLEVRMGGGNVRLIVLGGDL